MRLVLVIVLLLVAIGGMLGGAGGALTFFIMAAVMNIGSYWFSADLILRMSHAREVSAATAKQFCARKTSSAPSPSTSAITRAERSRAPPR